ncbi:MAG: hypothetical protein E7Z73_02070 [Methanobrevibacter millerae]|uniref:Uncharacterized protein n=1 Tax=Methanobrevibacter millerae TaxID=230361 RepID=A0A8T3V8W7_9EURY|nr:hypothetical protein [Methanobrevibacter millerae]MBE6504519.1 hypothetical protein [Methanobrevibacter millerae]
MKRIILFILVFLLIGCVYASDFSKVTVNRVDFEIPSEYSSGDTMRGKYVYKDIRTFAILCEDDYLVNGYGGYYDIVDDSWDLSIDGRPARVLTMFNNYIDKNVSYLYFPVNRSVYCICYQGNDVNESISHIVESAPGSSMSSDTFYGLLDEAYKAHEDRQYLDTVNKDYSDYVSKTNQHKDTSSDRLVKWYLLSH